MNNKSKLQKRANILFFITSIIVLLYTLKLFSLQIVHGDTYRTQSINVSQRAKRIHAQRGEIFDRNSNIPLVLNIESFAVDIIPGEIPSDQYDTVLFRLSELLEVSKTSLEKKLPINKRSYQSYDVLTNVSYAKISQIAEKLDELPGVSWHSKPIRNYVETGSISHILGYVGNITNDELKIYYNKGYTRNSVIGKAGVEKQYDELLRGTDGFEYRTVDAIGRNIQTNTNVQPPESGKNLILTIDRKIQLLAQQALGDRIGSVVVLKPSSGEVVAMVSYPFFDPNIFNKESSGEEYLKLLNDKNNPLLNRAINAKYPPASTFKIIMSTAILSEDLFPMDSYIDCLGEVEYGDRLFRCHIRKPGHGPVDLKNALAQSCDVYYWAIGRDYLGVDRIASYSKEFGLGKSSQIDLPSQTEGFVPSPQWKERKYHEKWLGGDTMNLSIGQGYIEASPLQMANVVAMVINDGVIYKPHVLKEVIDPSTNTSVMTFEKKILTESTISEKVFKQVREDMRYVITHGTAQFPMNNKNYPLAGKTGTAEVGLSDRWHSWMVAYGPYDAPVDDIYVIVVMVEASNPWEWWAPYATNIIFQGIFADQDFDESVRTLGFQGLPSIRGRQE